MDKKKHIAQLLPRLVGSERTMQVIFEGRFMMPERDKKKIFFSKPQPFERKSLPHMMLHDGHSVNPQYAFLFTTRRWTFTLLHIHHFYGNLHVSAWNSWDLHCKAALWNSGDFLPWTVDAVGIMSWNSIENLLKRGAVGIYLQQVKCPRWKLFRRTNFTPYA